MYICRRPTLALKNENSQEQQNNRKSFIQSSRDPRRFLAEFFNKFLAPVARPRVNNVYENKYTEILKPKAEQIVDEVVIQSQQKSQVVAKIEDIEKNREQRRVQQVE